MSNLSEKEKKNEDKIVYFVCPICGYVYPKMVKKKYFNFYPSISIRYDEKNGVTEYEDYGCDDKVTIKINSEYCPYDYEPLFYISDKVVPIALKLSELGIKFIHYSEKFVITNSNGKDIFINIPNIFIEAELSSFGKRNLDKLKKKIKNNPKLINWDIYEKPALLQNHSFKNEYDENGNITNTSIIENNMNVISIELGSLKNTCVNEKYINKSLNYLFKALEEIGIENADQN